MKNPSLAHQSKTLWSRQMDVGRYVARATRRGGVEILYRFLHTWLHVRPFMKAFVLTRQASLSSVYALLMHSIDGGPNPRELDAPP